MCSLLFDASFRGSFGRCSVRPTNLLPRKIINVPTIVARLDGRDQSNGICDFAGVAASPSRNGAPIAVG